ncbi:MAG: hypothetical protein ACM3UZ_01745 [Acidobacteriota bacterium]
MDGYERSFKGESIKDFSLTLGNVDLGNELIRSLRMGLDAFTGISGVLNKEAEKVNKKMISDENFDEFQQIKGSIHQFLDLGISLGAMAAFAALQAGKAAVTHTARKENKADLHTVKVIRVERGNSVVIPFKVDNDSNEIIEDISFLSTTLLSDSGGMIDAANVFFEPLLLTLKPHDFEKERIVLNVPSDSKPGLYKGAIYVKDNDKFKLPYVIEVV